MNNKVAVVTGAARGLGLAISKALLLDGFTVAGVDIDASRLEQAKAALGAAFEPRVCDVTQPDAVAALFADIAALLGGPDALVNNAGTCFMNDFVDISPEELRKQMAINFDSAFYCCQQAIPYMLKRPGIKKIVNISSNGAYNFEVFDPAHYRASKAALDTMTKHLARRYAKENVCVNSIAPAMTRTDLFDVVDAETLAKALAGMPRGRAMEPEEIGNWAAFLISPAGDCCSGNVIVLNQGRDVR
jgi:NAD(P)-dependent dehydrogenase (short-subunit alcohol dehydrogenase family)